MKVFLLSSLFSFFLIVTKAQTFTAGNLAILQADASANNTTCSIIEINPTAANQSPVTSVAINGTGTNALRFSGSASSTGYLANNNDGTLLCFVGANSTDVTSNANTLNPRGVGTLNNAQAFNIPATYSGTSGNQTRGATSIDNTVWYIGDQGGLYTNNATAPSPSGNLRSIKSFNNIVYGFTASTSSVPVFTISAPSGGTFSSLPGIANGAASRQDFYLVSSGTNGMAYDVLYILDATSGTAGTIFKYSFSSTNNTWVANGSYTTVFGGFGLAAKTNGSGANLYVSTGTGSTTANKVMLLTDVAGYNKNIDITTTNNITLYTAPTGKIVKGIAFSPVPAPSVVTSNNMLNFGTVLYGNTSADSTINLTASYLNPVKDLLTVTAPNTDFQVSNDGTNWSNSILVAYSNSGAIIGNFHIRFSPQTAGAKSGNVTITGGGLANAVNIAVKGTGDNNLTFMFSSTTTTALKPPYISSTINDPNDPAMVSGILADVKESGTIIPAANYMITVTSDNTTVVPNANIAITQADGLATVKINPAAVGYSNITLTLTKGTNSKSIVINYAASQSSKSTTNWLTGISNASTAISLDDDYMVIGDDETNFLYVFNRKQPGLPVKVYDFNSNNILALTDGNPLKEVDVEASVRSIAIPSRMYFFGSMSNSSSFNNKPNRDRLFAVNATGTGANTMFTNVGNYATLRSQLLTWGDNYGYNFTASAAEGVDPKTINGFNMEGMTIAPDNTTLYVGFRAPLVPTANRTNAVIAPIQNFETWFNDGHPNSNPTIGAPIELNLGGRGIREIYRLSNGTYAIAAGSYDGTSIPAIYTWSGVATDAPVAQPSFNVTGINAEALLGINENGQFVPNKLQVIADDGSMVFYGDGVQAKDLTQSTFNKFSSDVVVSPSTVLPIKLDYFTATKNGANVLLNWQTANGDNGVSFDILRSNNGQDFTVIQTVTVVAGKSNYAFTDVNVPNINLYYRIATKSADAQKLLSPIRIINLNSISPSIKIYPNPIIDNIFSVETNSVGEKKLGIYNNAGVLYKYFDYAGTVKDIYTNGWPRGTYLVQIFEDGKYLPIQKIAVQ